MEDSNNEIEILEVESEEENVNNQIEEDDSYSDLDVLHGSASETDSADDVEDIQANISEVQKRLPDSTNIEIQSEATNNLDMGNQRLTLETKAVNYNWISDDEDEDFYSRNAEDASFVEKRESMFKSENYDYAMSSWRKKTIDKTILDILKWYAKATEKLVENNQRRNRISNPIEDASPSPDDNSKKVDECSFENSKNESVLTYSEQVKSTTGTASLESTLDAKLIEKIVKEFPRSNLISNPVEDKSPNPSISADKISKKATDECSSENSKGESVLTDSKQVKSTTGAASIESTAYTKVIEKIVKEFLRGNWISNPVEDKSPNPSISSDKNSKKVTDECSSEISKNEFVVPDSEQMKSTRGTLSLESTAEEVDASFYQYLRMLKPKLYLLLTALKESKLRNKYKLKFPQESNRNINVPEAANSNIYESNLSKVIKAENFCGASIESIPTAIKNAERRRPKQKNLEVFLDDNQIANMKKNIIQTYERTITLTEQILSERSSQTYQMQSSESGSNSEKKTVPGQSGLERQVRSKTEAIPSEIIAGKNEKDLNETVYEIDVKLSEAILKTINWADVHEEGAGNSTRSLESISTSTDLSIASHYKDEHMPDVIALREMVVGASERVKTDILYDDFAKLLEKVIDDGLYIDQKCREFLCDLRDTLDVNIRINKEKLFKIEIVDFKEIVMKLEERGMESCSFLERVLELPTSNLAINLSLKKKLRESIERVYMINSNLTRSFEMIIDKLRAINDRLVIEGFQEASVRYMMVDFLEIIKIMNTIIQQMQNTIQCIDEILLAP